MIYGICCNYCRHFEEKECPVKSADPWSKHEAFCYLYIDHQTGMSIQDMIYTRGKSNG